MMDLEEMKSMWASVDERLGKQELLKESIIRKMIREKSNRSLRKLLNFEIFSLAVNLFAIPLILLLKPLFVQMPCWYGNAVVAALVIFCTVAVIWQMLKIAKLMNVDFMKSVRNNSLLINTYNLWIGKEKIAGFFLAPAVYLIAIWYYAVMHVNAAAWTFLVCTVLFSIFFVIYVYRQVYDRHIDAIRQSLEELKDLEEEQE
jgi:hypothetical protein